jgi:hypothetical protein
MSLSPEICLRGVLDMLQTRIAPALTDSYAAEGSRLAGLVLTIVANGIDDAAAIRIAENEALRALFRDVAADVADAGLAAAGSAAGSGYRLSELDADNARLRATLVDLHAAVEDQPGEPARAIDHRIWRMLRDFEVARAPRR